MKYFILICFLVYSSNGFYLPGVSPHEYEENAKITVMAGKLSSMQTQVSFPYYSLGFCHPNKSNISLTQKENLGEALTGDLIQQTEYEIFMNYSEKCKLLCSVKPTSRKITKFKRKIDDQYSATMLIDNLPSAYYMEEDEKVVYYRGYPIGKKEDGEYYINNHLSIIVQIHPSPKEDSFRIVGFKIHPQSINYKLVGSEKKAGCIDLEETDEMENDEMKLDGDEILFTYDVNFEESKVKWSSRWDVYINSGHEEKVHWFSITNCFLIILFLSIMVGHILKRALKKDIDRYNMPPSQMDEELGQLDETGWKQVKGDAFRPPPHSLLLSTLLGTGIQLTAMGFLTIICACIGFLTPEVRGSVLTAMILFFVFLGILGGYIAARFNKLFKNTCSWIKTGCFTNFLIPAVVFAVYICLNVLIWIRKDYYGAVPLSVVLLIVCLWVGIEWPLSTVGAFLGMKKDVVKVPCKVTKISSEIKIQPSYLNFFLTSFIAGIIPFGAVFIELIYIMISIWTEHFYFLFGFLFLVMIILVIACSEISIVICYFQLCNGDHHWWWRSFCSSGTSGIYVFLYAIYYYFKELQINSLISTLLYFGHMLVLSSIFTLITGTIGFLATFLFVKKIYSLIKSD